MLILPPGHAGELATLRPLRRRELRVLRTVAVALTALLVGAAVLLLTAGGGRTRDCINITFASSLGGQQLVRCGADARAACAAVNAPGGYAGRVGQLVATDCRRLGLPAGR